MKNTLFVYRRYSDEVINVTDLQNSQYFDNAIWEHIATLEPRSFIQTVLSENKAVVHSLIHK